MRYIKYAHIANLVFLTFYFLLSAHFIFWIIWALYAVAAVAALSDNLRWMRLAMGPPLLIFLIVTSFALFNIIRALWYHPPLLVSPLIILMVILTGWLPAFSSGAVLSLYWFDRKVIFKMG